MAIQGLENVALLALELVAYCVVLGGLLRFRARLGPGAFMCALGTFHFIETYLAAAVYVTLPFGIVVSPGSSVLFSGKLVFILLLYIGEDARTARQPIYGLLVGNFMLVGLSQMLKLHTLAAGSGAPADLGFLDQMGWLMVWGTALLYIDSLLIILLYERLGRSLENHRAWRIAASALVVLTFDQAGFFVVLRLVIGVPYSVLWGGWLAKMLAGLAYAGFATLYLRADVKAASGSTVHPRLGDVLDALIYRDRYRVLLDQSERDPLTGLFNRAKLDRAGRPAIDRALAAGGTASLFVLDVDRFKAINDTFGHMAGDEVLQRIAEAISGAVRPQDLAYRYGGDEFLVLCEGMGHDTAMSVLERLEGAVAAQRFDRVRQPVAASIGVASGPQDGHDFASLFETADARLYAVKRLARHRAEGRDPPPGARIGNAA